MKTVLKFRLNFIEASVCNKEKDFPIWVISKNEDHNQILLRVRSVYIANSDDKESFSGSKLLQLMVFIGDAYEKSKDAKIKRNQFEPYLFIPFIRRKSGSKNITALLRLQDIKSKVYVFQSVTDGNELIRYVADYN